jgi:hypothetical protein
VSKIDRGQISNILGDKRLALFGTEFDGGQDFCRVK